MKIHASLVAFVAVMIFVSGFVLGMGAEAFNSATDDAGRLAMIQQARGLILAARERCFLKYPAGF